MPLFRFVRESLRDLGWLALGLAMIGGTVYGLLNWTLGTIVVLALAAAGWAWVTREA